MRILVLGGNGGSGRHLVNEALIRGHDVHALVRDPDKLGIISSRQTCSGVCSARLDDGIVPGTHFFRRSLCPLTCLSALFR